MRTRNALRFVAKWLGVLLAISIVGAWLATFRWHIDYVAPNCRMLTLDGGNLTARWCEFDRNVPASSRQSDNPGLWVDRLDPLDVPPNRLKAYVSDVWHPTRSFLWLPRTAGSEIDGPPKLIQTPDGSLYEVRMGRIRAHTLVLPLWYLPVFALLVAAYSLRQFRFIYPPGHCKRCNYNMTGNVSGKCPECGTPTPKPEPPAQAPARDPNPL